MKYTISIRKLDYLYFWSSNFQLIQLGPLSIPIVAIMFLCHYGIQFLIFNTQSLSGKHETFELTLIQVSLTWNRLLEKISKQVNNTRDATRCLKFLTCYGLCHVLSVKVTWLGVKSIPYTVSHKLRVFRIEQYNKGTWL